MANADDAGVRAEDAGVKEEAHYELSWSPRDTWDELSETRRMAHAQATKLSDLRLCCYYALCIWAVTFLIIGAGFFAASAMPASAGYGSFDVTGAVNTIFEQIDTRLDLLYEAQLGLVFTPVTLVLLAIPATLWVIVLALTLTSLFCVTMIAIFKTGWTICTGRSTETSQCSRVPGVLRVSVTSAIVAFLAYLLQPLLKEASLIAMPQAVEGVICGVVDHRELVAFFTFTLVMTLQVSGICKRRIREWGVYGWKASLLAEHPVKPDHTIWERLGAEFPSNSIPGRFLERIALPVCAITLVMAVAVAFIAIAVPAV